MGCTRVPASVVMQASRGEVAVDAGARLTRELRRRGRSRRERMVSGSHCARASKQGANKCRGFRDICSNRAAEYPSGTPKMLGSGRCWGSDSRHGTAGTCLHRVGTMPVLLYNLISCQCRFFCK